MTANCNSSDSVSGNEWPHKYTMIPLPHVSQLQFLSLQSAVGYESDLCKEAYQSLCS